MDCIAVTSFHSAATRLEPVSMQCARAVPAAHQQCARCVALRAEPISACSRTRPSDAPLNSRRLAALCPCPAIPGVPHKHSNLRSTVRQHQLQHLSNPFHRRHRPAGATSASLTSAFPGPAAASLSGAIQLAHPGELPRGKQGFAKGVPSRCAVSTAPGDLAEPEGTKRERPKFQWTKHWYPTAVVADLDLRIPSPIKILGLPMVIWFSPEAQAWRIFSDACPHRLAPLSEGRVDEKGHLQCSYHGWTFNASGHCTSIPQAPAEGPPVHASPRACAQVYPSQVHQGILWVWPELSPGAETEAAAAPLPVAPELDDPSFTREISQIDVMYGYEMLVENLVDPAHVHFAHHGLFGGNRAWGKPLDITVESVDVGGIVGTRQQGKPGSFTFTPPCSIAIRQTGFAHLKGKGKDVRGASLFYCVPTEPGRSRLIVSFPQAEATLAMRLTPRWFRHLGQMTVLDSDLYLLHVLAPHSWESLRHLRQMAVLDSDLYLLERRLAEQGGPKAARRAYYIPTKADSFVAAFHRWFSEYADAQVGWAKAVEPSLPETPPKDQLLDRQLNHVRLCKSCRTAQSNFELLQKILAAVAMLTFFTLSGLAAASVKLHPYAAVAAAALGAICTLGAAMLQKFISENYKFKDYIHALVP